MAKDTRSAFLRALEKVEPDIARAFEAAIQDVRSTAQMTAIEAAIRRGMESGNVLQAAQEVGAALQLGREFFAPLDDAMNRAFVAGGAYQAALAPERSPRPSVPAFVVRFDGRHERAENWIRQHSAKRITEIADDARLVIRKAIDDGITNSRGYKRIAQQLVGKLKNGKRVGGLIGLHSSQAEYAMKAQSQLKSLDPDYFRWKLRDKRFDRMVEKAIEAGKPLSADDTDKIVGRFKDKMLKSRANTIARTEGNAAMNAGRSEAVSQMIESGKISPQHVTKVWDAVIGPFTRESHVALNGQEVGWYEAFVSPSMARLDRPHDPNAPAKETINCRCSMRIRIDYAAMAN